MLYHALRCKPELVLAVAPALLAAPIALAAGRLASAKTWLHVQDLEIEAAFELGILKGRRLMDGILNAERRMLRQFDLVSSISPKMIEAIEQKGVPAKRLMLMPNWVDTGRIFPLASPQPWRQQLGITDDRCIVLYSGSMGQKQGLEILVAAARDLAASDNSPLFVIAGDGPARPGLEVAANGLSNVMLLPLQSEERFNELLNAADIHLLPQRADAADLVMPSKLGAIFAVGKPVIATVSAQSQIALAVDGAGIIVPPEDAKALAEAIRQLSRAPEQRRRMGEIALGIGRSWDTTAVLGQAEQHMIALCRHSIMVPTRRFADV
jgi:colanic acid biosynthesis glycosyl transferase WcaI